MAKLSSLLLVLALTLFSGCNNEAFDTENTTLSDQTGLAANAGQDQNVQVGTTVTLDATQSSSETSITSYQWELISPSGSTAVLDDPSSSVATFTADVAGIYIATLTISDGVSSDADSVTVTATTEAQNAKPTANAGPDQDVKTNEWVQLDGSASYDPNDDNLSYAWSFVTIPQDANVTLSNENSPIPVFKPNVAGSYILELIVNDGIVDSVPDRVTITVNDTSANSAPVADAGLDQNVKTGSLVELNGTGSSDADNDNLTYSWSFVSTPSGSTSVLNNPTTSTPSFTPDVEGNYVVSLTVNDGNVDSAADSVIINVTDASQNSVPVADAGSNINGTINTPIDLNGTGSYDADGDLLTYQWSVTRAPSDSNYEITNNETSTPIFTGDTEGNYIISLIVNDGTVDSEADTITVTLLSGQLDEAGIFMTVWDGLNEGTTIGALATDLTNAGVPTNDIASVFAQLDLATEDIISQLEGAGLPLPDIVSGLIEGGVGYPGINDALVLLNYPIETILGALTGSGLLDGLTGGTLDPAIVTDTLAGLSGGTLDPAIITDLLGGLTGGTLDPAIVTDTLTGLLAGGLDPAIVTDLLAGLTGGLLDPAIVTDTLAGLLGGLLDPAIVTDLLAGLTGGTLDPTTVIGSLTGLLGL